MSHGDALADVANHQEHAQAARRRDRCRQQRQGRLAASTDEGEVERPHHQHVEEQHHRDKRERGAIALVRIERGAERREAGPAAEEVVRERVLVATEGHRRRVLAGRPRPRQDRPHQLAGLHRGREAGRGALISRDEDTTEPDSPRAAEYFGSHVRRDERLGLSVGRHEGRGQRRIGCRLERGRADEAAHRRPARIGVAPEEHQELSASPDPVDDRLALGLANALERWRAGDEERHPRPRDRVAREDRVRAPRVHRHGAHRHADHTRCAVGATARLLHLHLEQRAPQV